VLTGFRARLIAFSILAVAPIFGVRFLEIWQERDAAIAAAQGRVTFLAQQAATRQADLIADTRALLNIVKSVPTLRQINRVSCDSAIAEFRDARPWIEGMSIADAGATIRCSATPGAIGVNIADRAYLKRALATGKFVVSDLVLSRVTRRPTVVTALPVKEADGNTLIFLATLKLSWLDDLANRVAADMNGDIFIVDADGDVITSHIRYGVNALPERSGKILNKLATGREGAVQFGADGQDGILFGYAAIPDTTARVFIGTPFDSILKSVHRQTRNALRDLALAFGLIIIVAWIGGELLFVRPMRNLDLAAHKIADGDYGTRAEEESGPVEFRRLGKTFNVMVNRLESLAEMDPMTGLANRRQLDRYLRDLWRRDPTVPVAIAMIDVDHFKHYNDYFGHVRGDKCLQAVANIVKSFGRRNEDLAARFGGEEFTLVIPGMTSADMADYCDELRQAVERLAIPQPDKIGGVITVSAGIVSVAPVRCPDSEMAIRLADEALYVAKKSGRNRVTVYQDDRNVLPIGATLSA